MALPPPLAAVATEATHRARSVGQLAAAYAVLALIGLTGAGFLMAALYIWLASVTDPLIAALAIGGALLLISAIWAGFLVARNRERMRHRQQLSINTALMASGMSLADSGLRIISRSKTPLFWPAVATVAAAWYLSRRRSSRPD